MGKIALMFFLTVIVAGLGYADDYDEVRELLMAEKGGEIQYLSKINLGIPGGDNWIANRGNGHTYVYTIGSDKQVKYVADNIYTDLAKVRYWDPNLRVDVDLEYDIMQHIPGTQLGSKAAKFGDFNGDGIDEIFDIAPYHAGGFSCGVSGYDNGGGKMASYIYSRFDMTSSKACPVGFYNYQGREGLMIHVWNYSQERYFWLFCVWDEESREYIDSVRIWENDEDYSIFMLPQAPTEMDYKITNEPKTIEVVPATAEREQSQGTTVITAESVQPEETVLPVVEGRSKGGKFVFVIIIIGGVVLVVAAAILLVARKKRKSGFPPK
jgi:hypothetical protein